MSGRDAVRRAVLDGAREMDRRGLVAGTAGNVAARVGDGTVVVTPSSLPYATMTVDDLVVLAADGTVVAGDRPPTAERALHLDVLAAHPEVGGVVHCHARHASMFALAHRPIPAVADEVLVHVGGDVPVCPYRESGSAGLGRVVADALGDRSAVLMANHGMVTVGPTVAGALRVALLVEHHAAVVWGAEALGGARPLPAASRQAFAGVYGLMRQGWRPAP